MNSLANNSCQCERVSRRTFLRLLKVGAVELGAAAVLGWFWGFKVEPGWVVVEQVELALPRLSPAFFGLRVAVLGDIHMGGWMNAERLQHVVDKVVAEKPDLICLTGDYLLGHGFDETARGNLADLVNMLTPLAAATPTYAVLGNHDYWTNARAVRQMLRDSGITELTNAVTTLTRDGEQLHLCGIDDLWEGDVRLETVLAQLPAEGAALLLAHEPDFADTSAATGRFDLQISGHSHGGQVVIPFYGPPVVPYLGEKYPLGLYDVKGMFQYTNRGVGMASLPVRINCPPEITLFTLNGGGG
jgi:predicted MPP superfamily phosphohydrolase